MGKKLNKAIKVAEAQAGLNKETAITQAEMNMINQTGPGGSTVYEQTGTSEAGNPQYSVTQTLSPEQQGIYDQKTELAGSTLGNAQGVLGTPADFGTVPEMQGVNLASGAGQATVGTGFKAPELGTGYAGGELGTDFAGAQLGTDFQNSQLGTDFSDQGQDMIYELGAKRLDPRFEQEAATLEATLAAKGIRPGMEAYDRAKMEFEQYKNDAYNQLMLTGLQTASGIAQNEFSAGMTQNQFNSTQLNSQNQAKLLQAGITNQQLQLINQGKIDQAKLTNEQLQLVNDTKSQQAAADNSQLSQMNAAQIQQAELDLQKQMADNQAALQQAQANNDAAQTQYLMQQQAELLTRQTAIQEAQAATTMGQVAPIGTINTPQTGVATADLTGTYGNLQAQAAAQQAALMGGIGSVLGSGANALGTYMASDRRLKTDARKVGKLNDGTPVHAYRYKGSPLMQLGVMAQDIEETHPKAVHKPRRGMMSVDYGRLAREVA